MRRRRISGIVLSIPLPIAIMVGVPFQSALPDGFPAPTGSLATLLLGAWIVLWFLDRIGKLPGGGSDVGFTDADRHRLNSLHSLLSHRDDDGIERFLKFIQDSRTSQAATLREAQRTNELLERLIAAQGRNHNDPK